MTTPAWIGIVPIIRGFMTVSTGLGRLCGARRRRSTVIGHTRLNAFAGTIPRPNSSSLSGIQFSARCRIGGWRPRDKQKTCHLRMLSRPSGGAGFQKRRMAFTACIRMWNVDSTRSNSNASIVSSLVVMFMSTERMRYGTNQISLCRQSKRFWDWKQLSVGARPNLAISFQLSHHLTVRSLRSHGGCNANLKPT